MEISPEVIDIGSFNSEENNVVELKRNVSFDDEIDTDNIQSNRLPSMNFGSGIELLMNDKKKHETKKSSDINIDDITDLENELNDLTESTQKNDSGSKTSGSGDNIFSNLFNMGTNKNVEKLGTDTGSKTTVGGGPSKQSTDPENNLGKNTAEYSSSKSWDGYGKFNDVPLTKETTEKPKLTREEELREKFKYIRKLEALEKKGATLTQRYNMDSNLDEMIGEYEMIMAEKEKSNSMKFQGKMLMAAITGIEFLNNKFDPFDIKLDGWAEQLNENIDDYDDIFAELHEKYKSKASMAPELKLLFQLGGSAAMMHMTNTMFKSSMPGMDDIMRQNPELMREFSKAAVNTMGESNPGFGGFMNNIMGNNFGTKRDEMPNVDLGPPPSPIETKLPERSRRETNIPNRPDIMSARDDVRGVDLSTPFGAPNKEEKILTEPRQSSRPEMRGPSVSEMKGSSDVNSILSGLKTKQINIGEQESNKSSKQTNQTMNQATNQTTNQNNLSTISIEDLKDLTNTKLPKSKRKQKSDKNTVSLDI